MQYLMERFYILNKICYFLDIFFIFSVNPSIFSNILLITKLSFLLNTFPMNADHMVAYGSLLSGESVLLKFVVYILKTLLIFDTSLFNSQNQNRHKVFMTLILIQLFY